MLGVRQRRQTASIEPASMAPIRHPDTEPHQTLYHKRQRLRRLTRSTTLSRKLGSGKLSWDLWHRGPSQADATSHRASRKLRLYTQNTQSPRKLSHLQHLSSILAGCCGQVRPRRKRISKGTLLANTPTISTAVSRMLGKIRALGQVMDHSQVPVPMELFQDLGYRHFRRRSGRLITGLGELLVVSQIVYARRTQPPLGRTCLYHQCDL